MLTSAVRLNVAFLANVLPGRQTCFHFEFFHLSQKYLSLLCSSIACYCVVCSLLPSFLPRPSRAARLPNPASRSVSCRAASVTKPRSIPRRPAPAHYVSRPCCCTPCPVPRARRGAAEVLPMPSFPTRRSGHCRCLGRRDERPQQEDVAMKVHVASVLNVSEVRCNCFI
jgi:hypothetical protein